MNLILILVVILPLICICILLIYNKCANLLLDPRIERWKDLDNYLPETTYNNGVSFLDN